jgi:AraC-like DNA-binding protein
MSENIRVGMESSRSELGATIARFAPADGVHATHLAGVHCVRYSTPDRGAKRQWRACLAIVAQGCKEVLLGRHVHRCDEGRYTATPIPLPVVSRIAVAAPNRPFLGILIDLDANVVREVAAQIESPIEEQPGTRLRALFTGAADDNMLEAAARLTKALRAQENARVLGPLIIRDLFFYLLKGPEGEAIRQFVHAGSAMHRIASAVFAIRTNLHKPVDVGRLARAAGMSRSAFFQHFRDVTAMSPIQYQKRLRLLEARRLMVDEDETAERSSFIVGYRSASQFSREYIRMFGVSPRRDTSKIERVGSSLREL